VGREQRDEPGEGKVYGKPAVEEYFFIEKLKRRNGSRRTASGENPTLERSIVAPKECSKAQKGGCPEQKETPGPREDAEG